LGVLLVPSREKNYRASRWHGFSCTCDDGREEAVGPLPGIENAEVRFSQWKKGESQEAYFKDPGILTVPVPIAFALPPHRYAADDVPWNVMGGWHGIDALGATFPGVGAHYGVLDDQEWGNVTGNHV